MASHANFVQVMIKLSLHFRLLLLRLTCGHKYLPLILSSRSRGAFAFPVPLHWLPLLCTVSANDLMPPLIHN